MEDFAQTAFTLLPRNVQNTCFFPVWHVSVQSYAKAQSYANMTGKLSEPKGTRYDWRHAAVEVTVLSTSDKFPGLNINNDGTFILYGKFTCLNHSFSRRFILGNYLSFFGMCAGIRR